jgi:hypothetical protein
VFAVRRVPRDFTPVSAFSPAVNLGICHTKFNSTVKAQEENNVDHAEGETCAPVFWVGLAKVLTISNTAPGYEPRGGLPCSIEEVVP